MNNDDFDSCTSQNGDEVLAHSVFDDIKPCGSTGSDRIMGFWIPGRPSPRRPLSNTRVMEGNLFYPRGKDSFFKSRYYVLYADGHLAFYKSPKNLDDTEAGYIYLPNTLIERIFNAAGEKDEKFGFRLCRNGNPIELYCRTRDGYVKWMESLKKFCTQTNFSSQYVKIKDLAQGATSKVFVVKKANEDLDIALWDEYAVKAFDKDDLVADPLSKDALVNELNILRTLDNDGIIKFGEVFEDKYSVYYVMELLSGGDLYTIIKQKGVFSEHESSTFMKVLLEKVAEFHAKGVMHRDLKPENLLLKRAGDLLSVQITDFGLAAFTASDNLLFKRCGTPGYVAPEILNDKKYDCKVDIYSLGVILYILLTGYPPFSGQSYQDVVRKNTAGFVDFEFVKTKISLSPAGEEFLKQMLALDPKERFSALEALEHPWIRNPPAKSDDKLQQTPAQMMRQFQDENRFNMVRMKEKIVSIMNSTSFFSRGESTTNTTKCSGAREGDVGFECDENLTSGEMFDKIQKHTMLRHPMFNSPHITSCPSPNLSAITKQDRNLAKFINAGLKNFDSCKKGPSPFPLSHQISTMVPQGSLERTYPKSIKEEILQETEL